MFDKDYIRVGATMEYTSNVTKMPVYVNLTNIQVTADIYQAQPDSTGEMVYNKTKTVTFPYSKLDKMYFVSNDEFKQALRR